MSVNSPHELFVFMLNSARQSARPTTRIFQELGEAAGNDVLKAAVEAGVFVAEGIVEKDQCFKLMADRPVILSGRREETFVEDFGRAG
jgi:glucokinase